MLNQKVLADAQKVVLDNIIQEHNKAHNPSGVHFKGAAKRPAPKTGCGNEAKDDKTYASELDGPKEHIIVRAEHRS